jgi:predicted nucleic-acid-binding Zn-ribbon protein
MRLFGWLFGGEKGVLGHKEATTVEIHGYPLRCQICGHREFWRHDVQLHTRTATFFDMDWLNAAAICAVCDNCGYIHWFLPPPAKQ